jgi:hypothetical protein
MQEFLIGLSPGLEYLSHEYRDNDAVVIMCKTVRGSRYCPYCAEVSGKICCRYKRKLKDIPFGEKKVTLIVLTGNYFCSNTNCSHSTFGEKIDFAEPFATRTKRLDKQILELTVGNSGIGTERYIKRNFANVSDTTINRIIKKNSKAESGS